MKKMIFGVIVALLIFIAATVALVWLLPLKVLLTIDTVFVMALVVVCYIALYNEAKDVKKDTSKLIGGYYGTEEKQGEEA